MQEQAFHRSDEIDSKKNRYFKNGYNLHGTKMYTYTKNVKETYRTLFK